MRSKVIADSANHGWPKYLRYLPAEPVEIHKGVQINHHLHVLVAPTLSQGADKGKL